MKSIISFIMLAFAMLMMPLIGFAQEAAAGASVAPPEWLGQVISFISNIPKVGPVLGSGLMLIGVIGAVFTALSTCIQAVLAVPQIGAKWLGAHDFAEKVKKFSDAVLPWLKYFSIYNVQKK